MAGGGCSEDVRRAGIAVCDGDQVCQFAAGMATRSDVAFWARTERIFKVWPGGAAGRFEPGVGVGLIAAKPVWNTERGMTELAPWTLADLRVAAAVLLA